MNLFHPPYHYDRFDPTFFLSEATYACGPVYTWVWNCEISAALIDTQIDEMYARGVRTFYILPEPAHFRPTLMETHLQPDYLSEDFFTLVRQAALRARELGMSMWLYDEGGWPSGSACGDVTKGHPSRLTRALRWDEVKLSANDTFSPDEYTISAFIENTRIKLPYTAKKTCTLTVYSYFHPDMRFPYLLDQASIQAFISCTYEKYRQHLGDLFGSTVHAIFTDEAILHYPFYLLPADLQDFEQRYGYDFASMVPALFKDTDSEGARMRADYIDYCGTLFANRYLGALQNWCKESGIAFTGHMNGDHTLAAYDMAAGNVLTHLRHMHIPGVDTISRQIYPGTDAGPFPRFASSAATAVASPCAVSESFGVYGAMPYSDMRYICGYQLVRGINILNFMVIPAGRDRYLGAQERPAFLPEDSDAPMLPLFNEYISRIQYLCRIGKRTVDTAVYAPMRDVWAWQEGERSFLNICDQLERLQIPYDIIDDHILSEGYLSEGALCYGEAAYNRIYLPECKHMRPGAKEKLKDFTKKGGIIGDTVPHTPDLTCSCQHIRLLRRDSASQRIYLLFNESQETQSFTVKTGCGGHGYLADLTCGHLHPAPDSIRLHSGEMCALIYTDETYPTKPIPRIAKELCRIRPTECVLTSVTTFSDGALKRTATHTPLTEPYYIGSGSISLHAEFDCTPQTPIIIELQDVHDCATVSINGRHIGSTVFSPHIIYVTPDNVAAHNRLDITVVNSSAAAYADADITNAPSHQLGPYYRTSARWEGEHKTCGTAAEILIYSAKTTD